MTASEILAIIVMTASEISVTAFLDYSATPLIYNFIDHYWKTS